MWRGRPASFVNLLYLVESPAGSRTGKLPLKFEMDTCVEAAAHGKASMHSVVVHFNCFPARTGSFESLAARRECVGAATATTSSSSSSELVRRSNFQHGFVRGSYTVRLACGNQYLSWYGSQRPSVHHPSHDDELCSFDADESDFVLDEAHRLSSKPETKPKEEDCTCVEYFIIIILVQAQIGHATRIGNVFVFSVHPRQYLELLTTQISTTAGQQRATLSFGTRFVVHAQPTGDGPSVVPVERDDQTVCAKVYALVEFVSTTSHTATAFNAELLPPQECLVEQKSGHGRSTSTQTRPTPTIVPTQPLALYFDQDNGRAFAVDLLVKRPCIPPVSIGIVRYLQIASFKLRLFQQGSYKGRGIAQPCRWVERLEQLVRGGRLFGKGSDFGLLVSIVAG
jgi:hypothetical protein